MRLHFVDVIENQFDEVRRKKLIDGYSHVEIDAWLITCDSITAVFQTITILLNHNTGFQAIEAIPLEIAIGLQEFDQWAVLKGNKLTVEGPTIDFLKTKILEKYRKWFKEKNPSPIKSTYILCTTPVYSKAEIFEKLQMQSLTDEGSGISFFILNVDHIISRANLLAFLTKIGRLPESDYRRIDQIFVPPNEYDSMLETLEKSNVLFLIGDPEIGKTYSAVRIMWEYYLKGYTPIWDNGGESLERKKLRRKISDCEVRESNTISYMEDIFGKTKYENRDDLDRQISLYIDKVTHKGSKVIISTRESLFKEFQKETPTEGELKQFIVRLDLKKPSYDKTKLSMILYLWAFEFQCKWLKDKDLSEQIVKESVKKLTTPLGLREFACASAAVTEKAVLIELIKKKSKKTRDAFGREVTGMPKEDRLFLTLICILKSVDPKITEGLYNDYCQNLSGFNLEQNSFDCQIRKFSTRIEVLDSGRFDFYHPSYEEGIISSWSSAANKSLAIRILNQLSISKNTRVRGSCGFILIQYFYDLPFQDDAKAIIMKILGDKKTEARFGVAQAVEHFSKELPDTIRAECLKRMFKDTNRFVRRYAVYTAANGFSYMPIQNVNEFISNGLEDKAADVRLAAVDVVKNNIDMIPVELVKTALRVNEELCNSSNWNIGEFANIIYRILKERAEARGIV